jgi:hypothetical protein
MTTTADGVKHTFLILAQRIDGAVQLGASNLAANPPLAVERCEAPNPRSRCCVSGTIKSRSKQR